MPTTTPPPQRRLYLIVEMPISNLVIVVYTRRESKQIIRGWQREFATPFATVATPRGGKQHCVPVGGPNSDLPPPTGSDNESGSSNV